MSASVPVRSFTYDGAGNVISEDRDGDIYTYSYNATNRMSSMSLNGSLQAEYKYNALGQQVWRKLHPSGQIIHSLFDPEGNRIAEYDYTGGSSTLIREYIWLNGRPVAVVENGVVYYVRTDHIGRPVFATDSAGTKVWEASYLPFGEVLATTGTPMELRFPGQWFQAESGLHQNWMRDYDPTTGRYMQADPLGLVDGASVYGYARQNPGRYVDPRGEYVWTFRYVWMLGKYALKKYGSRAAGAAAAGAAIPGQDAQDEAEAEGNDECETCPPCQPYPAGTIGYREDNHDHNAPGVGSHHLNLYRVNQNPKTCRCQWNAARPRHVNPPPQPGWIPLPSTGRYGARNVFPPLTP